MLSFVALLQCDQIGRFYKIIELKFSYKLSGDFWSYYEKRPFKVNTVMATSWAAFAKFVILLIFTSGHTSCSLTHHEILKSWDRVPVQING